MEAHLQELLAQQIELLGPGHRLIRREYYTAIGPVDILAKDADDHTVAVEIKRVGGIDGVEQLTRYRELLDRDPLLAQSRLCSPPKVSNPRPAHWLKIAASLV